MTVSEWRETQTEYEKAEQRKRWKQHLQSPPKVVVHETERLGNSQHVHVEAFVGDWVRVGLLLTMEGDGKVNIQVVEYEPEGSGVNELYSSKTPSNKESGKFTNGAWPIIEGRAQTAKDTPRGSDEAASAFGG